MNNINKSVICIILGIIFIAVFIGLRNSFAEKTNTVEIIQDGNIIYTLDLNKSKDELIQVEFQGHKNIIQIKDKQISIIEADNNNHGKYIIIAKVFVINIAIIICPILCAQAPNILTIKMYFSSILSCSTLITTKQQIPPAKLYIIAIRLPLNKLPKIILAISTNSASFALYL